MMIDSLSWLRREVALLPRHSVRQLDISDLLEPGSEQRGEGLLQREVPSLLPLLLPLLSDPAPERRVEVLKGLLR